MIFGVGTDIIEVERVARVVSKGRQYLETIFTDKEMDYCESKAPKIRALRCPVRSQGSPAESAGHRLAGRLGIYRD